MIETFTSSISGEYPKEAILDERTFLNQEERGFYVEIQTGLDMLLTEPSDQCVNEILAISRRPAPSAC